MDRAKFFDAIRTAPFPGRLTQSQVEGTESILDAWTLHAPTSDLRFVAYSLATAYHETAATMQPIEEYGKGRGRAYGHPSGPWGMIYDGRGDVQLTWYKNYVYANTQLHDLGILGASENLAETPMLAMRSDVAAAIMIFGMMNGWFTGKKFSDFFVGTRSDWVDARKIINGTDKAALIAGHGLHFYHALTIS